MATTSGQNAGKESPEKGIRLLSLDGGPEATPTVLTLKNLLGYILEEENGRRRRRGEPEKTVLPPPAEYFDLIGGSGSGGLIALMLGPLRMGIGEVEVEYWRILEEMKSAKSQGSRSEMLRDHLRRLVAEVSGDADSLLLEDEVDSEMCKTFVCAFNKDNINATIPTLFRTYHSVNRIHKDCKIWEAGRATTAMPDLFEHIEIGRGVPYVGGGLGANNPTRVALEEAIAIFNDRRIACVVSIGTGHSETISLSRSSLPEAAYEIAKDSGRTHEDMLRRFSNHKTVYHRFNVQQGLQMTENERMMSSAEVESHTNQYVLSGEVKERMKEAARILVQAAGRVYPSQLLSPPPARKVDGLMIRPPPSSRVFTGREDFLEAIEEHFLSREEIVPSREQKRFVLYGLGGAGKTQVALEFIRRHSSRFTKVYLVDASSEQTINSSLENIGLEIGLLEPTAEDTLDCLCRMDEKWLLLYDNADDPSLDLNDFFPPCNHGNILITSRNRQASDYAQPFTFESSKEVHEMLEADAMLLLKKLLAARRKALDAQNEALLPKVVATLGALALALVQCGAYVAAMQGMTFERYLDIFEKRRKELMDRAPKPRLDQYGYTVYTTWEISFNALGDRSRSLLEVCSFLHSDGITPTIFTYAALNFIANRALDHEAFKLGVAFLSRFSQCSPVTGGADPEWDDLELGVAFHELTIHSLVQENGYVNTSVHPLVQSFCKDHVLRDDRTIALRTTQAIAALSADYNEDEDSVIRRRLLTPHIHAILAESSSSEMDSMIAKRFARSLGLAGQHSVAEKLWLELVRRETTELGATHEDTLTCMNNLASTYSQQGRDNEAETLKLEVLENRKHTLGLLHPDTLLSMNNLASTYSQQGRHKEAEVLELDVLEKRKHSLGPLHPDTLTSMSNLASTYSEQGRQTEAEALKLEVLENRKQTLGPMHPDTVTTMGNLASTYSEQGRYKEAEALALEVLESRQHALGPLHPITLLSMNNLANTYWQQGRHKEAEVLELEVLENRKETLGLLHPDTLTSMSNLASTYSEQGRHTEARTLKLEVLEKRKLILGPLHPDILSSMNNLASTYGDEGRHKEAEALELEVLEKRKCALGPTHPATLTSLSNLAITYTEQGRYNESTPMLTEVVQDRQAQLGADHPATLASITYLEDVQRELMERRTQALALAMQWIQS